MEALSGPPFAKHRLHHEARVVKDAFRTIEPTLAHGSNTLTVTPSHLSSGRGARRRQPVFESTSEVTAPIQAGAC
eukprot:4134304-Alexandrium_andersonii.AAC.1